ncbi:MAG: hypothetical protein J2P48_05250 [Alphaproteobacteria bacterium]|nr:hypothetical protein [Alphaproteobacteria bacterium]
MRSGTHLTLLADQKMNDGIPVPSFGRPAIDGAPLPAHSRRYQYEAANLMPMPRC